MRFRWLVSLGLVVAAASLSTLVAWLYANASGWNSLETSALMVASLITWPAMILTMLIYEIGMLHSPQFASAFWLLGTGARVVWTLGVVAIVREAAPRWGYSEDVISRMVNSTAFFYLLGLTVEVALAVRGSLGLQSSRRIPEKGTHGPS